LAQYIESLHISKQLGEAGPRYDPDDDHGEFAGGARAFDPTHREGWGTIATGRYQTVASRRAAGEHFSIEADHLRVAVRLCDGDCSAEGPLAQKDIDYLLGYKKRELAACYHAHGDDPFEVKLELVIGIDGKVREAHGPGRIGGCAAKVASAV